MGRSDEGRYGGMEDRLSETGFVRVASSLNSRRSGRKLWESSPSACDMLQESSAPATRFSIAEESRGVAILTGMSRMGVDASESPFCIGSRQLMGRRAFWLPPSDRLFSLANSTSSSLRKLLDMSLSKRDEICGLEILGVADSAGDWGLEMQITAGIAFLDCDCDHKSLGLSQDVLTFLLRLWLASLGFPVNWSWLCDSQMSSKTLVSMQVTLPEERLLSWNSDFWKTLAGSLDLWHKLSLFESWLWISLPWLDVAISVGPPAGVTFNTWVTLTDALEVWGSEHPMDVFRGEATRCCGMLPSAIFSELLFLCGAGVAYGTAKENCDYYHHYYYYYY